jgi:PAS domain S-box-containing protein
LISQRLLSYTGMTRVIGKYRELPARRKDGMEFLIQLAVVEIVTGSGEERLFCGFVHDLSAQKRAQEIMRGTIDTSLDPVLHINDNGIIQMVNNAACYHLGYDRHELVGENVSVIVGGGHGKNHGKYIERYLETGEKRAMGQKRKLRARRKDGSELPIELGLSEIRIDGGKELMFCAFLTIISSERMRQDDQESSRHSRMSKPTNGDTNGYDSDDNNSHHRDPSEVVENSEAGVESDVDCE